MWKGISIVDHARRWAQYTPDRVALTGADGAVTWQQLDAQADAWAGRLSAEYGVVRGDRVVLLAHNHPDFFSIFFACRRLGAVLAPLNWRLAIPELDDLLALAGPKVLLHDVAFSETAAALRRPEGCGLGRTGAEGAGGAAHSVRRQPDGGGLDPAGAGGVGPNELQAGSRDAEETALLLFTSGTTGRPKAAMLPDRQLFFNGVNTILAWRLTGGDETLLFTPLFHTGAINVLALPLLQAGGTVHVQEAFSAPAVVDAVGAGRVSVLFGVPVIFRMLAEAPGFFEAAARLRLCLCGGAPLPISLIREYESRGLTITQGFGMTEAGPNCFFLPPAEALSRAGSVGIAMPYCDARIAREDGSQAGPDEVGELWMRGPHVFAGYFENRAATEGAFQGGWFRTGDLLRKDRDGYFHVAGRAKEMFISGGENVYPAEIENALAGHPAVLEAAVLPMPDERWGEVGHAFVVPVAGAGLDFAEIRTFLRTRLAAYKIPRGLSVVAALPRNSSGKVARSELSRQLVQERTA